MHGRPLPLLSLCRNLESNELFLLSPHSGHFDSRYYGVVLSSDLLGTVTSLATMS